MIRGIHSWRAGQTYVAARRWAPLQPKEAHRLIVRATCLEENTVLAEQKTWPEEVMSLTFPPPLIS